MKNIAKTFCLIACGMMMGSYEAGAQITSCPSACPAGVTPQNICTTRPGQPSCGFLMLAGTPQAYCTPISCVGDGGGSGTCTTTPTPNNPLALAAAAVGSAAKAKECKKIIIVKPDPNKKPKPVCVAKCVKNSKGSLDLILQDADGKTITGSGQLGKCIELAKYAVSGVCASNTGTIITSKGEQKQCGSFDVMDAVGNKTNIDCKVTPLP